MQRRHRQLGERDHLVARRACPTDRRARYAALTPRGEQLIERIFPEHAAVIADAGHPLLFGDRNKMPKFRGKLTPEEIDDLAKFVIGQKGK